MARTRVRLGRVGALAGGLLLAVNVVGEAARGSSAPAHPAPPPALATHVVAEGDTLWTIARRLVGTEGDPRPVIQEIRELNGLSDPALVPGQPVLLPVAA